MARNPSSSSNPESGSKSRSKADSSSDRSITARSVRHTRLYRAIQAHNSAGPHCGYVADSELDEEGYATCVLCDSKVDIDKARGVYRANGCTHMFCHDCRETWIRRSAQKNLALLCPAKHCEEWITSFVSVRSTLRAKRGLFRERELRSRERSRVARASKTLNARAEALERHGDGSEPGEGLADRQTSLLSCLPAMSCLSHWVIRRSHVPDVRTRSNVRRTRVTVTSGHTQVRV